MTVPLRHVLPRGSGRESATGVRKTVTMLRECFDFSTQGFRSAHLRREAEMPPIPCGRHRRAHGGGVVDPW